MTPEEIERIRRDIERRASTILQLLELAQELFLPRIEDDDIVGFKLQAVLRAAATEADAIAEASDALRGEG